MRPIDANFVNSANGSPVIVFLMTGFAERWFAKNLPGAVIGRDKFIREIPIEELESTMNGMLDDGMRVNYE